jgi:hypothetical protein
VATKTPGKETGLMPKRRRTVKVVVDNEETLSGPQ